MVMLFGRGLTYRDGKFGLDTVGRVDVGSMPMGAEELGEV